MNKKQWEALLTANSKQWDTVVVELNRIAQNLPGMTVTSSAAARRALALKDFDERKARGLGLFVTRADILARNPSRLSDLLRDKRGVRVVRLVNLLRIIPRPLRDLVYNLISRYRTRWFGRRESCRIPGPEERDRFLP